MTILAWGARADTALQAVIAALARRRARTVVMYEDDAAAIAMAVRIGDRIAGTLDAAGATLDLDEVTAVYLRPTSAAGLAGRHVAQLSELLHVWADAAAARVVNRPSAMASNLSKPHQLRAIRAAGFAVPATLVTTSPDEVARFAARHGTLIYKSLGGTRSIVSRLAPGDPRLGRLACPTQFQERIDGRDLRVHVVGDRAFACAIDSPVDDYRYARRSGAPVALRPASLDPALAARCVAITRELGLHLAGIDLRRTADGREVCFEVNTAPAFVFFDRDAAIADAIAALLIDCPSASTSSPGGDAGLRSRRT